MREPRIYVEMDLAGEDSLDLPATSAHHVSRVLRMRSGQRLWLFNGNGPAELAEIVAIDRRKVAVKLLQQQDDGCESSLEITLVQCISRAQHMDYTLQKAVELGVSRIVPIASEFSNVKISDDREATKLKHWQQVIVSATEQCGRNRLARIEPPMPMQQWFDMEDNETRLILHPGGSSGLGDISPLNNRLSLLAGPEGGFSDDEVKLALAHDYLQVGLGPRILRTETAPVAALSLCQFLWGDLAG